VYGIEHGPTVANKAILGETIATLKPYWASKRVSAIKGATCREYANRRGNRPTARRELETLRAAVNYFHKEYGLDPVPAFTMPPKPLPRERWLTRNEAARLLWAARRNKYLSRFILIALYTGTRSGAILRLGWMPSVDGGWIDAEKGLLYRAAQGQRQTKKRQPTATVPERLLPHVRRWQRNDNQHVRIVNANGRQLASVKKAFRAARERAGLDAEVIPHALRHTSVTWAMQEGIDKWQACGFYGLTMETLEAVYGHHHPDFQQEMRGAFRTVSALKQLTPTGTNENKRGSTA